jgi:hypothetical protein
MFEDNKKPREEKKFKAKSSIRPKSEIHKNDNGEIVGDWNWFLKQIDYNQNTQY